MSVEALTDPLVRILRCAHNRPRKEQGTALPAGGQECQRSWPRARRQPSERKPHRAAGQRPRTHGTDVRKSPTTAEDAYYFDLSTARARPCLHRHPPCAQDPQLRGCASPGPATEETWVARKAVHKSTASAIAAPAARLAAVAALPSRPCRRRPCLDRPTRRYLSRTKAGLLRNHVGDCPGGGPLGPANPVGAVQQVATVAEAAGCGSHHVAPAHPQTTPLLQCGYFDDRRVRRRCGATACLAPAALTCRAGGSADNDVERAYYD